MKNVQVADTDEKIMKCREVILELRPHLIKEEFVSLIKKLQQDKLTMIFIGEEGNAVAAACFVEGVKLHRGKFIYIDRVVVSLSQQGRGIGKLLYEDLLSFAKANNTALITCEFDVVPPNEISRRFHERFGFKEVSTLLVGAYEKQVSLQALSVEMLN